MSEQHPISQELLDILRCPDAIHNPQKAEGHEPGKLRLVKNVWLVSDDSGNKYPIRNGIPVMLPEVGRKYKDLYPSDDTLPDSPPASDED